MALKTTRWRPDTCGCEVEYQWDDSVPQDQRTHALSRVVKQCANHQGTPAQVFSAVVDENPRKNSVLARAQVALPSQFDAAGNFLGTWSYDAARVLRIVTVGLTGNQKRDMQTWCDQNIGVGKVEIS